VSAVHAASLIFALTLVGVAIDLVLLAAHPRGVMPGEFGGPGYQVVMALAEGTVGLVVAVRRRRNPVGWALLVSGLAIAVSGAAHEYAYASAPGPTRDFAIWIDAWLWAVNTGAFIFAFFRFPDGAPVGPGWLRAERILLPGIGLGLVLSAFVPGPTLSSGLENPLGLAALSFVPPEATNAPGMPATLAAAASLVARYRRSRGIERQQVKWLAASVALVGTWGSVMVITQFAAPGLSTYAQAGVAALTPIISLSLGIAILRYRLYDIDVLINRVLIYGVVSAVLVATYGAGVLLLQALLRPFTAGSDLAVAASTLMVVALFQPIRARVQGLVDRRFYRARYDAVRTVDAFAARLRNEVELDAVRADLLGAVGETVRPQHASVWLR
jgi:hypothetical protein